MSAPMKQFLDQLLTDPVEIFCDNAVIHTKNGLKRQLQQGSCTTTSIIPPVDNNRNADADTGRGGHAPTRLSSRTSNRTTNRRVDESRKGHQSRKRSDRPNGKVLENRRRTSQEEHNNESRSPKLDKQSRWNACSDSPEGKCNDSYLLPVVPGSTSIIKFILQPLVEEIDDDLSLYDVLLLGVDELVMESVMNVIDHGNLHDPAPSIWKPRMPRFVARETTVIESGIS
jgi:hypothetical protein